jgi:hypothetical protein
MLREPVSNSLKRQGSNLFRRVYFQKFCHDRRRLLNLHNCIAPLRGLISTSPFAKDFSPNPMRMGKPTDSESLNFPPIRFLGHSIRRYTSALHEAHHWQPFRARFCPALSGIELLNDGGYYTVEIDPAAKLPAQFKFHPLPRRRK